MVEPSYELVGCFVGDEGDVGEEDGDGEEADVEEDVDAEVEGDAHTDHPRPEARFHTRIPKLASNSNVAQVNRLSRTACSNSHSGAT